MSTYVTKVVLLVKDECYTAMLHEYMTLCRLIVYPLSIEESKHWMIDSNLNMSSSNDQSQPRFNKKVTSKE